MPYFVYIIRSELDGSYYVGSTRDLSEKIRRHNQGRYYELKEDNYVIMRTPPLNRAGLKLVGTLAWKRCK
jgi:hypothetical protein